MGQMYSLTRQYHSEVCCTWETYWQNQTLLPIMGLGPVFMQNQIVCLSVTQLCTGKICVTVKSQFCSMTCLQLVIFAWTFIFFPFILRMSFYFVEVVYRTSFWILVYSVFFIFIICVFICCIMLQFVLDIFTTHYYFVVFSCWK